MKKILVLATIALVTIVSCSKINLETKEKQIYLPGTEWVDEDDNESIGLKFYTSNEVSFFISSGANVFTSHGTYEYLPSIKKISFDGVYFYDKYTFQTVLELKGAQIIDNESMKISLWYNIDNKTGTEAVYLYKQ